MKYFALLFLCFLSACGGDSKVGNLRDRPPVAKASVFGVNVSTSENIVVRSGADVFLSGQNSDGFDDPLLTFHWSQVDAGDYPVSLFERGSHSRVFTAPELPASATEGIELTFQLDVEDADGISASDRVSVTVIPVRDSDHFLLLPNVDERFAIIAVAEDAATLTQNIPIAVTIQQTAVWVDRQGQHRELVVDTKSLNGVIPVGQARTVTDKANEYFLERVPRLDIDEVNKFFQAENRAGRLELELVKDAALQITIDVEQQAPGNVRLHLARNGELGFELIDTATVETATNRFEFASEWLRHALGIESKLSAENYYKCIDPLDQATTLSDWLAQAGYDDNADDVVRTNYVNNYDLNFGRDMYVRQDDLGNVYSYVVNYPTLENTLSNRNDFAVVVVEFSAAPTGNCGDGTFAENDGGKKIVKFYAYVPDETTGEYVRTPTMNFDGRGERALPGVCIACHFGDDNTHEFNVADFRGIDADAADLNASLMIWDLDAFLYTHSDDRERSDPVYAANEISEDVTQQYSRAAQEESFRLQNQAVLHTFTYDINQLKRFETPIKLLHGLYGNANFVDDLNFGTESEPLSQPELMVLKTRVAQLPANEFDGEQYVQPGWVGNEPLYQKVFARHCRLCHAQIGNQMIDFDNYDEFITNARLIPYVYKQGIMPLSRLTMDRFWSDFNGELSAAEFLREHLNADANPNNNVESNITPGAPVAIVTPEVNAELDADVIVDFDRDILFDGSESLFADSYQWRVDGDVVSTGKKYIYSAGNPGDETTISFLATHSEGFSTSELQTRRVQVRNNVPTLPTVPRQSVVEGRTVDINIFSLLCPGGQPDEAACRSVFGDINQGALPTINITSGPVNGVIDSVDATTGTVRFRSTDMASAGNASFFFTVTDSFNETSLPALMEISVNALAGPQIVGPDRCTSEAISSANEGQFPIQFGDVNCPDPSANDTASAGLMLRLVAVNGDNLQAGASVNLTDGGDIQFQPARFFVGQESFTYTVQDNSPSMKRSVGTVLVNVEATQTFNSLSTGLGIFADMGDSGCAECHTGNQTDAPNWLVVDNVRLAATNTHEMPYGAAEMTLSSPTTTANLLESILFKKGCGGNPHDGGNRLCNHTGEPTSVSDLNTRGRALLRWLEEGARNN